MVRLPFAGAVLAFTLLGVLLGFCLGQRFPEVFAGGAAGAEDCSRENGDINADGQVNLADAVTVLNHLFLGGPAELVPLCAGSTSSHLLPATGQTKCYSADGTEISCDNVTCQGQDGKYALGCSPKERFMDGGDGTVLDTCTGLVWQQEPGGFSLTWCEALAYCEKLSFADHDDWRLPNVRELQSLVDYGRSPPLDPLVRLVAGKHPAHWSSTPLAGDGRQAWNIAFGSGNAAGLVASSPTSNRFTVRAVRTAE